MDDTAPTGKIVKDTLDEDRIYLGLMSGDEVAWNELYDYVQDPLLAFFKTKNVYIEQDRDDLLMATMAAFISSLERYDLERCPLKNWIFRIATNVMTDHQQKYSAEYEYESSYEDSTREIQSASAQHSRSSDGVADPRLQELRSALESLPKKDQQILKLRSERDSVLATWNDIAEELGIGISAAKMRHKRALSRLREKMLIDAV